MARFNLEDYETVEQRIARFYTDNPDGRLVTDDYTTPTDREQRVWRVRASVYLSGDEQERGLVKATGVAFEVDGTQGANQTAALENAETSAIGRALANAGYSGNKRTSREEMAKVQRGVGPAAVARPATPVPESFLADVASCDSVQQLREMWESAGKGGFLTDEVKAAITARKTLVERAA